MDPSDPALRRIVEEVLAPAFSFHAEEVVRRAAELRLDRLYFLARDGHLLRQLHDLEAGAQAAGAPPRTGYLRVSRRATALAAARGFGPREVALALDPRTEGTRAGVLGAFGLDDAEVRGLLAREGIVDLQAPVSSAPDDPFTTEVVACAPFQRLVAARAGVARSLLRRYLEGEGYFAGGRVGIVDVGWAGTIQDQLERAFAEEPGAPRSFGLYLGLTRVGPAWAPGTHKEGALFDLRRGRGLRERSPFHLAPLFDVVARASEGTTVGYLDHRGRIEPVARESGRARAAERSVEPAIAVLQELICAQARERARARGRTGMAAREQERGRLQRLIERLIFLPSAVERVAIGQLVYADDDSAFGALAVRPAAGPLQDPQGWLEGFHAAPWKPAYLAATGGPLLCRAFRVWEEAKTWLPDGVRRRRRQ